MSLIFLHEFNEYENEHYFYFFLLNEYSIMEMYYNEYKNNEHYFYFFYY